MEARHSDELAAVKHELKVLHRLRQSAVWNPLAEAFRACPANSSSPLGCF